MVPWFVQLPCSLWLSMAPQLPSQPDWRCPSGFRFLISQHQYNQLLNLKEIKSPLLTLEQSKHSHVDYPGLCLPPTANLSLLVHLNCGSA